MTEELSEAEESSCSVVVGVEESKRLLLENEEDGVDEFEVLGEVVQLFKLEGLQQCYDRNTHVIEHFQLSGPASVVAANRMEDAISRDFGQKLLDEERQQPTTNECQVEVVDDEGTLENERLATFHQFSSAKDYDVVRDQSNRRLFVGGHGRLARVKLEIDGIVAHDGRVGLCKEGP